MHSSCAEKAILSLLGNEFKAGNPYDSVKFDVLDHFSIYFLHDPLDFVFTLADNSAKIEIFLIFSDHEERERETENK
jgi:hypothetical protein